MVVLVGMVVGNGDGSVLVEECCVFDLADGDFEVFL